MSGERDPRILGPLRAAAARVDRVSFCVAGAGNGGLAMAGHLGIMGFPVSLYNRTEDQLAGVRWHGGVEVEGEVTGFGPIRRATADMGEALEDADVIMVVTPATAHAPLAHVMAPFLRDGQVVLLNPGRTGGALEFRKVLLDLSIVARPVIAEAQTFIYASRAINRHTARIFRIKNEVPVATLPSYWIPETLAVLRGAFPQFTAGGNVLATSMENIGAIFHPALTILNAGWIEETKGDFEYYLQGITPSVAKILERIDQERLDVARALGVRSVSAREWLYLSYDSPGRDLHEAIHHTEAYRGIKAPLSIAHRYIWEDVPMSLVPIVSIGAALGVPTPTTQMVVQLGSLLHGRDYAAEGRTVESLGLAGLSLKEIHRIVADSDELEPMEGGRP
ncbi:MAG TPA: NAD/NADP octopine/nopaline dehydrogenase family protein [Holophaga sp.]|nr:NAD/NADP octopine/nopaline dehydrogenase family protein [Holophaga sp.]HPS67881.1 NAD/NADP octopine/nopaline dehydrogenase family protein [Holophaga sp.]